MNIKQLLIGCGLLLSCLVAMGQPSPINRRAFIISSLATPAPTDIPSSIGLTIRHRWMSTRFATNATISTGWPDQTNNSYWIKATNSAATPTNSSLGVWLDTTHYFYGSNTMSPDSGNVFFAIIDHRSMTADGFCYLLSGNANYGQGYAYIAGVQNNTANTFFLYSASGPSFDSIAKMPTNTILSLIYTGGGHTFYTNGVAGSTENKAFSVTDPSIIGAEDFDICCGFNGWLKEFITFTDTSITSGQISNLTYYASHYPY